MQFCVIYSHLDDKYGRGLATKSKKTAGDAVADPGGGGSRGFCL